MPPVDEAKRAADLNAMVEGLIWVAGRAAGLHTPAGYAAARGFYAEAVALKRELTPARREAGGFARPERRPELTEEQWLAAYAPTGEAPT